MGNKITNVYDNESISQLKGAERVRLRPSVIFGSDGIEGCEHSFFEILSNSIDEAREGYGKVIEVTRFRDRSIMMRDYGRGIPVDFNNNEQKYNWELIFCELYAGGKYKNNENEGDYEYSLGLNGLGTCATQYSSEYFDATIYRDGYKYTLHFEKGENVGGLGKEACAYKSTGSIQKWKPDSEVFTDIDLSLEFFQNILKKQAVVNEGILFKLYDEETKQNFEYIYKDGIRDYINELAEDKSFTSVHYNEKATRGRDRDDKEDYKLKMQVAFCFNNEINVMEYYHNSSFLEHGGAPDKAVRAAFISEIDKAVRTAGKYTKDESKIIFQDIQDSLIIVTNCFSTKTSYANQTKKAITNKFIQDAMTEFIKHCLEIFFIENKLEGEKVIEQVLINKRSRESAEKQKLNIKKKLQGNTDISNRVKKFVDCRSKDIDKREIYIVEGDSALGSCKTGRDSEFQAIIPVRGKPINCFKADFNKILENDIILDLLRVLGCGIEVKTKHNKEFNTFDLDNLKWNKIIICTDADVDGFHIRTMILTMIYKLAPTLINKEKVFIAESPLYEIKCKGKTYFAFDEREKAVILSKLNGKYSIQRSKGLGENEPEMMWETTMNPETRRLIKVMPDDIEKTERYFDILLGDNIAERKVFIEENGGKYLDLLDVD